MKNLFPRSARSCILYFCFLSFRNSNFEIPGYLVKRSNPEVLENSFLYFDPNRRSSCEVLEGSSMYTQRECGISRRMCGQTPVECSDLGGGALIWERTQRNSEFRSGCSVFL